MRDLLNGDRAPFILAAAALNAQLGDAGHVRADIDSEQPVSMVSWRVGDNRQMILLGNLEEGLSDGAGRDRVTNLSFGLRRCKLSVLSQQSRLIDAATCR